MTLTNIRDISPPMGDVGAGFQFEFVCESCGETWKTPFRPYRAGQAAGFLRRFGYIINEFAKISVITDFIYKAGRAGGTSVEVTGAKAKTAAREEAIEMARQRYDRCGSCKSMVCANCFSESSGMCLKCEAATSGATRQAAATGSASATVCSNCQTPSQGGRFCHECGFDMASTHKSCPSCGATMSRQARFCTDCGHGF